LAIIPFLLAGLVYFFPDKKEIEQANG